MTHIVHPYAHRLGGIRDWKSQWTFSNKEDYKKFLKTDYIVRNFLSKKLESSYVSSISFERHSDDRYVVKIFTSRIGVIVGKDGKGVEKITNELKKQLRKNNLTVPKNLKINLEEVLSADSDAGIVACAVKEGLERKMPFRRVLKTAIEKSMADRNVKGIKISVSGRLGGADMARKESLKKGRIPLSTFRADVDYREARANLPYGVIGVKVWIYRGEIFKK